MLMKEFMKYDLMEMLFEAGYQEKDIFHHYTDLYIFKNSLTTKVIKKWVEANGLKYEWWIKEFTDAITGFPMYDICFQYHPVTENQKGVIGNV